MTKSDRLGTGPAWRRYLRLRGTDVRADVADELEFHIDMIAERLMREGMSREQSHIRAREQFGDLERARRLCVGIGEEQQRRREWGEMAESVLRDVRVALRGLRRAPGFTATIVLTLALGIGASTAIFTVVRGVLLRPLPYADPDRLVHIWEVSPRGNDHNVVSPGNYVTWSQRARSFSAIGMHTDPIGISLVVDGEPSRIVTADMTPSVMRAL